MTLQHVTDNLAAKALAKPGITHSIGLQRGLRIALRFRRKHYTLSLARVGVYPSVAEKAILRRCFAIPTTRTWRTSKRQQWHIWYIFWNPDKCDSTAPPNPSRQLPIAYPAGVGPKAAPPVHPGGPTNAVTARS